MGLIKSLIFVGGIMLIRKFHWRLLAPILVYGIDVSLHYLGVLVVEIPFYLYSIIYIILAILLLYWTQYAYAFIKEKSEWYKFYESLLSYGFLIA